MLQNYNFILPYSADVVNNKINLVRFVRRSCPGTIVQWGVMCYVIYAGTI